jgi:hypothetical protein
LFPSADDWAQLEQEFPVLDDDVNPALNAIAQGYKKHQPTLEECYEGQYMPLEPVPETVQCEDGTWLEDQDRENAIRINRQLSKHQMPGALHGLYEIYWAGAPFERLFFEARDQQQKAAHALAYERAQRADEKEDEFDDFNFIHEYLHSRSQISKFESQLELAYFHHDQLKEKKVESLQRRVRRRRRKYQEIVGDEFEDCGRLRSV